MKHPDFAMIGLVPQLAIRVAKPALHVWQYGSVMILGALCFDSNG